VREAPLMVTQSVRGSVPSCSFVAPVLEETAPGSVMGIVVPHLLPPVVYTVTLSMPFPSALVCHVMLGRHWSRAWRLMNAAARSSCLSDLKGQVVLETRQWHCLCNNEIGDFVQTHHLRGDVFDPCHEERVLTSLAIYSGGWHIVDSHIGLMEHVTGGQGQ